ncbi:MAG: mycothiol conjugate amidase Mca [Acidimicrobiales bacterium]
MDERLCLLTVHAHPDDESSKGPATVARYHADGVRTVLVCATGGEEGDILNPAMDRPEVRDNLAQVRRDELARAAAVIGYDDVVLLGYRDSGMPGTPANDDPRCFARAPLEEAVGRLVTAVRRERPQVVVTYGDDQRGYPHPDHLRVHEVGVAAFEAAADPDAYPGTGEPWQASKLYYTVWSRARMVATHEKFLELGMESPFPKDWLDRPSNDGTITTSIDVSPWADVRAEALLAHRTQVDPTSSWWFGLPPEVARTVHPFEEYALARDLTGRRPPGRAPGKLEEDLFAGVRDRVAS